MLDQFDESIEDERGRLVRYADDFLILTRPPRGCRAAARPAQELAADLLLQLNADSAVIDLLRAIRLPGLSVPVRRALAIRRAVGPAAGPELGWKDADRSPSLLALALPQETHHEAGAGVIVAGPGITLLDVVGDSLRLRGPNESNDQDVAISTIERLIVVGPAGWSPDAPGKLLRSGVPVHLLSDGGWPLGDLVGEPPDDPEALLLQCRAAADPATALLLARPLVRAKLRNFAALLEAATQPGEPTAGRLREMAEQSMKAESLDSLSRARRVGRGCVVSAAPLASRQGLFVSSARRARCQRSGERAFEHRPHDAVPPRDRRLPRGGAFARGRIPAQGDGRYASLASDLQEPFRHLVERAVILATRILRPSQFVQASTVRIRWYLSTTPRRRFTHSCSEAGRRASSATAKPSRGPGWRSFWPRPVV